MITRASRSKMIEKHKQETRQRQKENRQQEREARKEIAKPAGAARWCNTMPNQTAEEATVPQWAASAHRSHSIRLVGGVIF